MCFVFIWEQTATCPTYSINWWVSITEIKSVYCAVRTGSLNKAICSSSVTGFNGMTRNSLLPWTNQHTSVDTGKPEQRIVMVTGLWTTRSGFQVPGRARDFPFFPKRPYRLSGPFSINTPARPEREVDKALPTSAEVKNKWSYAATSYTPSWR